MDRHGGGGAQAWGVVARRPVADAERTLAVATHNRQEFADLAARLRAWRCAAARGENMIPTGGFEMRIHERGHGDILFAYSALGSVNLGMLAGRCRGRILHFLVRMDKSGCLGDRRM